MPTTSSDNIFMRRCLDLAKLGLQHVAPNPMVGAVLVHDNRIIGEGFHQQYGQAHAEVNAIGSVRPADRHLIEESTLYVNLEPCSHHGKTPPCSDLIIQSNIPRVVIGCVDSYSEVAGKGIEKLKNNNINVSVGILEEEARFLNRRFFTFHEKKRPYIILKWAQSNDGFIDRERAEKTAQINWVTAPETQQLTHQWRAEESAILVGHQTIINDNPSLTVRAVVGRNPVRIVLTSQPDAFDANASVLENAVKTIFIDPKSKSISDVLSELYSLSLQSVIIEGGRKTLQRFIDSNLWDEARVLHGNVEFKKGVHAPKLSGKLMHQFTFGNDFIEIFQHA